MPNTILFSSAFVRTASFALDEGSKRIRINFTASWTKEVREKMDWQEVDRPRGFKGRTIEEAAGAISLIGELNASTLQLRPNDKELHKAAIEFDIQQVVKFELVTVSDGDSTRRELRFQVITGAPGAIGTLEGYCDAVGQAKGELRISYVRQEKLDLEPTESHQQMIDDVRRKATAKDAD